MSDTSVEKTNSEHFINTLNEFDVSINTLNGLLDSVEKTDEVAHRFQSSIINFISFLDKTSKHFNVVSTEINVNVKQEDSHENDILNNENEDQEEEEDDEEDENKDSFIVFVNDKVVGFTHNESEAIDTMENYIEILRSSIHNICYYRSEYNEENTECSFYGFNKFLGIFTNFERLLFTISYEKVKQL